MSARRSSSWAVVFLALLLMAPMSIVHGATLAKLWEWFIADTFGVMAISTAEAIGLSMLVMFVTYQLDARNEPEGDEALARLLSIAFTGLFRSGFTLLVGAIVKGFI